MCTNTSEKGVPIFLFMRLHIISFILLFKLNFIEELSDLHRYKLWLSIPDPSSFWMLKLLQVPIQRGVVELDLCEVGGSETLRKFWQHYVCLGSRKSWLLHVPYSFLMLLFCFVVLYFMLSIPLRWCSNLTSEDLFRLETSSCSLLKVEATALALTFRKKTYRSTCTQPLPIGSNRTIAHLIPNCASFHLFSSQQTFWWFESVRGDCLYPVGSSYHLERPPQKASGYRNLWPRHIQRQTSHPLRQFNRLLSNNLKSCTSNNGKVYKRHCKCHIDPSRIDLSMEDTRSQAHCLLRGLCWLSAAGAPSWYIVWSWPCQESVRNIIKSY